MIRFMAGALPLLLVATPLPAQDDPPALLQIFREEVKVGRGGPTTVIRLIEDGHVIDRLYRTAGSGRTSSFEVNGAVPGEHRYRIELENSAGITHGGELLVRVAG